MTTIETAKEILQYATTIGCLLSAKLIDIEVIETLQPSKTNLRCSTLTEHQKRTALQT
jgi:hypothetical protein